MKHSIISAILAFLLSVCSVGNLITGYDLPIDSLWRIYLWCGTFAVVTAMVFRLRYGGRLILLLGGLCCLFLWKWEAVWMQMQTIVFLISSHYHRAYAWPVLGNAVSGEVSVPLILWAAVVASCVNCYCSRRKSWSLVVVPTVLPLVLCLATTDKVPDAIYLYLTLLGLAVLLISHWTRHQSFFQGSQLVLRAALPVAAFLALLFLLNPEETYVNRAADYQKKVIDWFQQFEDTANELISGSPLETGVMETLNLKYVGPKNNGSQSVMRVKSPVSGTQYLRGRDYDRYTGTGWEASSDRTEAFTTGGVSAGELTIVTYGIRSVVYVPYYALEDIALEGGAWENDDTFQRYSFYLSAAGSRNAAIPDQRYRSLPEDTLAWARKLASDITGGVTSDREKLRRIQNYVRNSAVYDLSTSRMDSQYNDFAQWFLEESETGYCVHFATAATVLLRAAGIPARYVEGYMVTCAAGEETTVSNRDAHAWAEYFDPDYGIWRVLEATPSVSADADNLQNQTIPETETIPRQTQEETENNASEPNTGEDIHTEPREDEEQAPEHNQISAEKEQETKHFLVDKWLKAVFSGLLVVACVPLQARIRIYRKREQWNRGKPNARTIHRWRQTRSLARVLKQPYPEVLDNLAQKAKFSQHRIRSEELEQFEVYRASLASRIRSKPWYQRLILKWLLAVE